MDSSDEAKPINPFERNGLSEDDKTSLNNTPREDENGSQCDNVNKQDTSSSTQQSQQPRWSDCQKYLQLIEHGRALGGSFGSSSILQNAQVHELRTSPLFSSLVRQHLITSHGYSPFSNDYEPFPQFGLLGIRDCESISDLLQLDSDNEMEVNPEEELVFTNMDAPWSTFICGSQGGGKSHTLSCLLENALLKTSPANSIAEPLAGLVFHYDKFSGFTESQLCEAAFLCSHVKNVRVLVAPTSEYRMRHLYSNLPGLPEDSCTPQVIPFYIQEHHLDISNLVTMMAVNENSKGSPLYLEVIYDVLRRMARENQNRPGIDFRMFESYLSKIRFTKEQSSPLNMRLQLLRSFLDPRLTGEITSLPRNFDAMWKFEPGTLTIVDLSDPFVKADDACALFSICLSIFMANCESTSKIVALDEAHKFLNQSGEATKFTEDLLQIIRQQRHLGTRVIIATQEPTLSPKLLDLSNVCIIHRFDSPAWFGVLENHLAGVKASEADRQELFRKIVTLGTGEALVFCPMALLDVNRMTVVPLKDNYAKLKIRKRITTDGGRSVMASDQRKNGNIPRLMHEQANGSFDFSTLPSRSEELSATSKNDDDSANGILRPMRSNSQSITGISSDAQFNIPSNFKFSFSQLASSTTSVSLPNGQDLSANRDSKSCIKRGYNQDSAISNRSDVDATANSLLASDQFPSPNSYQALAQNVPLSARVTVDTKALKARAAPVSKKIIDEMLHDIVTKSLRANPNTIDQKCYDKWRKECAAQLNVPITFFQGKPWKVCSRTSIKNAMKSFYEISGHRPPRVRGMEWLWEK